ncbi:MAG TPA: hypothetical protein VL403_14235 [Candidatus Kryptonia bacterium]|nr:hypothetical protein [Candidatus Kryptonia bacterium]
MLSLSKHWAGGFASLLQPPNAGIPPRFIGVGSIVPLCVLLVGSFTVVARADQTVSLAAREFAGGSPVAALREPFASARRRAADTTAAWTSASDDLPAWGPALIFPLLGAGLSSDTVNALAASLQDSDPAPKLVWRTLGLYAAKSRVPFDDTPSLLAAVNRNLGTINRAARDIDAFVDARELKAWGPVALGAWVAYLDLLFRDYWDLGNPGAESWNGDGLKIVDDLITRARLPDGKGFRSELRSDELQLWPNALILYALIKAYESEELVKYESAAIDAAQALEALRGADGAYFSAADRSAVDPHANAYLAGALLLLAKDTGDAAYQQRALGIMRWLAAGPGAAWLARDAGLETHLGYLIMLADSLAAQKMENIVGRRPMRTGVAPGLPDLAQLRPADFRYRAMFDGVLETLLNRLPRTAGDFAYDYGDAPGYATEILLAAHRADPAREVLHREQALLAWPRLRDFDEVSFGADAFFAAIDQPDVLPREQSEAALRRATFFSGALAIADRYDMDLVDWLTGGGGFDYGPTVIGAQIAHVQLRFAQTFPGQRVGWLIDPLSVGRALVNTADTVAWDESHRVYRARPNDDTIRLLPNAMMILALVQLNAITNEPGHLERAESVADGLTPLWDQASGGYFASSGQVGPGGYLSLSTNSYAALALHRLAVATGKVRYETRVHAILDFIQRDLYADGVAYHHFYRGHRSAGDIWCSGCNWRVLSVLREVMSEK